MWIGFELSEDFLVSLVKKLLFFFFDELFVLIMILFFKLLIEMLEFLLGKERLEDFLVNFVFGFVFKLFFLFGIILKVVIKVLLKEIFDLFIWGVFKCMFLMILFWDDYFFVFFESFIVEFCRCLLELVLVVL